MSDTDPYADPAAPNVYYPPVVVPTEVEVIVPAAPEPAPEEPTVPVVEEPVVEGAVPTGTIAEILAWVGVDHDRAVRALAVEAVGHKRKSLIKALTAL